MLTRSSFSNTTSLPSYINSNDSIETVRTRSSVNNGSISDVPTSINHQIDDIGAIDMPPSRHQSGPINVFFEKIKQDASIRSLFVSLKNGAYTLDLAGMTKELHYIQFNRNLRNPQITNRILQEAQKEIIEADLQHAAYRSRAAEIRMLCYELSDVLDELISNATKYMMAQYANELKNSGFTTRDARQAATEHVLTQFIKRKRELDRVIEIAKLVIDDLDKASFNINHIIEVLKLSVSRSRNL